MWKANKWISLFSSGIAKQEMRIKFVLVVELIHEGGPVIWGGAICWGVRRVFPCILPPRWIVFSSSHNASWSVISEELTQALTLRAVWQNLVMGSSCSKAGLILTAFSELQLLRVGLLQCRTFLFRWDFKLQKKKKEYFEMWRKKIVSSLLQIRFSFAFSS